MSRRKTPTDTAAAESLAARFWRSARSCRTRDLEHLSLLSELVRAISELVHALQKERGASSIYLGSHGTRFVERLAECVAESQRLESQVRHRLEHVDELLEPASCGARFYTRVAFAAAGLDELPDARRQVSTLAWLSQDAVKSFSDLIALLLAVSFEAADIAADPETSRALIALVNFAQGKEYAGQERAVAGAALSRGRCDGADLRRLRKLQSAQTRSFKTFADFADSLHLAKLAELHGSAAAAELRAMREGMTAQAPDTPSAPAISADAWYEVTTRRIDAMRAIEESIAADLGRLCALKLAEAKATPKRGDTLDREALKIAAPLAMLVSHLGAEDGDWYGVGDGLPTPMHSILEVVEAQSRRIDDISSQLKSARMALAERKAVERAKGILMRGRRLSESDAYDLLRKTAMNQNKKMIEVAEAVISMVDIFPA
ncbi:MAG TPA: nitrate- and nitrite sensing domain-containing protein [Steroidobacteraceae bacterium]|nr:nitrate- and nitrite sensing domain-containing protein [Steroidobacteraceae bacterium]